MSTSLLRVASRCSDDRRPNGDADSGNLFPNGMVTLPDGRLAVAETLAG